MSSPSDRGSPGSAGAFARASPGTPEPDGTFASRTGFATLSEADFRRLAAAVSAATGIKLPEAKRTMLQARLQKRLRALGLRGFREYCDLVLAGDCPPGEWTLLLDAVTTNKTDFFREPSHFEHLRHVFLPNFLRRAGSQPPPLRVWSAACSTGEEVYTLAMVLEEFAQANPAFEYSILGTDLSTRVLAAAQDAIYPADRANDVPPHLRRAYLMPSRDPARALVRVVPALRARASFEQINLMDATWSLGAPFHVVFLRNVLIYFDRPTQAAVLGRIRRQLRGDGVLYVGHSETLSGLETGYVPIAPAVYAPPRPGPG